MRGTAVMVIAIVAATVLVGCPAPNDPTPTPTPATYAIGDTGPAGGIVFYDDEADAVDDIVGARYLEAWTSDEGLFQWKTSQTSTPGTSTNLGSGYENTYTAMDGPDHPAAQAARNAAHGGFDDWFLPSLDELREMYSRRSDIAGFSGWYWSSSEFSAAPASTLLTTSGTTPSSAKDVGTNQRVWVIRAF